MARRYNLRRSTRSRQLRHHQPTGAPQDPTPRIKLNIDDLDLDKSYVKPSVANSQSGRSKKHRPWRRRVEKEPLTDSAKLPKGWHMNEDDLAIDDIDGQIERCHERIAENIMPHIFRQRLREYEAAKEKQEQKRSPGNEELSPEVIDRLHYLELMKKDLERGTDENKQIPNIKAILKAYRTLQLDWNSGLVTYWSNGVQICQPRPFDWDEFEAINLVYNGKEGFWTEGLNSAEGCYSTMILGPRNQSNHTPIRLALRAPDSGWFAELDFVHDTGSGCMSIYQEDLVQICDPTQVPYLPVVNEMPVGDCHGNYVTTLIVELEVTILDANRHRMTAWTRVPCSVNDGKFDPLGVPRLDGPAVRDLLYIGSAPDGRKMTYLATSKADLMLPELDLVKTPPSSIPRSRYIDPNTRTQVAGPSVPVGPLRPGYKRRLPMPPAASGVPP